MVKNNKKIILIFTLFIIGAVITFFMPTTVNATKGDDFLGEISSGVRNWENQNTSIGISTEDALGPVLAVAQFLYFIGGIVVLGGTIWLAIKYSMANPGEKAQTKERLIRWIIVCIVIMGSYSIWKLLVSAFGN